MQFKRNCAMALVAAGLVTKVTGVYQETICSRDLIRDVIVSIANQRFDDGIHSKKYEAIINFGEENYIFRMEKYDWIKTNLRVFVQIPNNTYINLCDLTKLWAGYARNNCEAVCSFALSVSDRVFSSSLVNCDLFQRGKIYLNFENTETFLMNVLNVRRMSPGLAKFIGGFLIREDIGNGSMGRFLQQKMHFIIDNGYEFLGRAPALDDVHVAFIKSDRPLAEIRGSSLDYQWICRMLEL